MFSLGLAFSSWLLHSSSGEQSLFWLISYFSIPPPPRKVCCGILDSILAECYFQRSPLYCPCSAIFWHEFFFRPDVCCYYYRTHLDLLELLLLRVKLLDLSSVSFNFCSLLWNFPSYSRRLLCAPFSGLCFGDVRSAGWLIS